MVNSEDLDFRAGLYKALLLAALGPEVAVILIARHYATTRQYASSMVCVCIEAIKLRINQFLLGVLGTRRIFLCGVSIGA